MNRGRPWLGQVLRHLALAVVTLFAISVVTFAATGVRSGESIAKAALGRQATTQEVRVYMRERGLDDPALTRYVRWLGDIVQGDLGTSPITNRPVSEEVVPRFGRTALLALSAIALAIPLALALGTLMARRAGKPDDAALLIGSIVLASTPEFVLAIGLIFLFSVTFGLLPVGSTALSFGTTSEQVQAYILPIATLVLVLVPYLLRMTRAAMREAFLSDHVRAALLRGLSRRTVIWGHALPSAGVAIVNAIAVGVIWVMSGTIVVEQVFGFPGLGQLLVQSIGSGDALTIQGATMLLGVMFVAVSLITDLAVVYLNPRLRGRT